MDRNVTANDLEPGSLAAWTALGGLLSLLAAWTVLGNLAVILALHRNRLMRSTANLLIGNLALSDMLLGLTVLPLSIVNDLAARWTLGVWLCNIWLNTDVLYCTASVWSLVMIAGDRLMATSYPVWYRSTSAGSGRAKPYIAAVWLLSIVICLPQLVGWTGSSLQSPLTRFLSNLQIDNETDTAQCELFLDPHYVIYSALGSFILPLFIMSAVYARIFLIISQKRRLLTNSESMSIDDLSPLPQSTGTSPHTTATTLGNAGTTSSDPDLTSTTTVNQASELKALVSSMSKKKRQSRVTEGDIRTVGFLLPQKSRINLLATSASQQLQQQPQQQQPLKAGGGSCRKSICKLYHASRSIRQQQRSFRNQSRRRKRANSIVRAEKRENRATKIMLGIMVIFILCWIPFTVMYITRALCNPHVCIIYRWLQITLTWFGYANSSINPILYTILNREFRAAFRKLIRLDK